MTAQELVEELQAFDSSIISGRCEHCKSNTDDPSFEDFVEHIINCPNCMIDIKMRGQWTGYGWNYLAALAKKDPTNGKWIVMPSLTYEEE